MREGNLKSLIFTFFVIGACTISFAQKDTYIIRLTRPSKIGDRYNVDIKGREYKKITATSMSGSMLKAEETLVDVELAAVAEVQAIDGKQKPSRIAFTIERCNKTEGGSSSEVVPRGRTVIVENDKGDTIYTIDGKRAKAKVAKALNVILEMDESESPSFDELFGTKERMLVGQEWDIKPMVAVNELKFMGIKVKPSDVSGAVQLRAVRKHEDIDVLDWGGRLILNNAKMPLPVGADGILKVEALVFGSVPVNPEDSRQLAESHLIKGNFSGRVRENDMDVIFEMQIEHAMEAKFSSVK